MVERHGTLGAASIAIKKRLTHSSTDIADVDTGVIGGIRLSVRFQAEHMRSSLALSALVAWLALAAAGCASREGTSSRVYETPSLAKLAGVTWTLVSLGGQPVPPGTRIPTAIFDGARVAGIGGCNRYTGQVQEHAPGTVTIGPLASTKMACPPPAMDVEDRYFALLAQVTQYRFTGSRLVLSGPSGELTFERAMP